MLKNNSALAVANYRLTYLEFQDRDQYGEWYYDSDEKWKEKHDDSCKNEKSDDINEDLLPSGLEYIDEDKSEYPKSDQLRPR